MPTLYGAIISPFVRKVRVVLAEKGIAYDLDPVIPMSAGPDYRKIHPLGKIPAFRDGDRTLADSSVICAYLERTHPEPSLYPKDPYEYARALWFEEFADGGLVNIIGAKIFFPLVVAPRFLGKEPDKAGADKAVAEDLPPLFDYLEGELGNAPMIVGTHFSIGDIGLATHFVNFKFAGYKVDAARWPRLAKYIDGVHARPSFAKIIKEERDMFGIN
jgi:glutathione S-transferase